MGKTLFITGTGTDVGKTALSLALVLWAGSRGLRTAYLKPIQCGAFPFGEPPKVGGDADWIRHLAGGNVSVHVTYRLRLAASPHLAAEREGLRLDPSRIGSDIESLAGSHDLLLVEGAGGAAVPFDRKGATLAALAARMGIPSLIACAPGLGTLHHTLATVAYLQSLKAPMAGFAFCHRSSPEPTAHSTAHSAGDPTADDLPQDELSRDNRETLAAHTGLAWFGALPYSQPAARGIPLSPAEAEAWWASVAGPMDAWWKA
jgi:dethiobiotin synthetase